MAPEECFDLFILVMQRGTDNAAITVLAFGNPEAWIFRVCHVTAWSRLQSDGQTTDERRLEARLARSRTRTFHAAPSYRADVEHECPWCACSGAPPTQARLIRPRHSRPDGRSRRNSVAVCAGESADAICVHDPPDKFESMHRSHSRRNRVRVIARTQCRACLRNRVQTQARQRTGDR